MKKLEHILGILATFLFVLGFISSFYNPPLDEAFNLFTADLSMPRQQQVLSDVIREWQGRNEQTNDMVIVGIRI